MRFPHLITLCLLGSPAFAQDIELERTHTRWRFGWETLDAGDFGDAELLGVHYDLLGLFELYKPFYMGLGAYTEFAGDPSGAFAAGFTSGVRYPISEHWRFESGLFLGGGAVTGSQQQRGWIARPFIAFERLFEHYGLRAELAYFDLDEVDGSLALSLGVTLPSEWLLASPSQLPDRISRSAFSPRETRLSPRFVTFGPSSRSESRDGKDLKGDFEMLGLGLDYFLNSHWFIPLEAYGATGGDLDGFGLGLVGLGYRYPLGDGSFSLEAKGSVGIASGGGVFTGGGLTLGVGGALRATLSDSLSAELGTSYITAPNGEFDATGVSLGLSWTTYPIELARAWPRGKLWDAGLSDEDAEIGNTRWGVLSKFYSPTHSSRRKSGESMDDTLSLIGIELEEPLYKYISATGRAFVAWSGEAGGYREGMLGLRASHSTFEKPDHIFSLGFEVGAGGGGQVDVGSGLLVNVNVAYKYVLDPNAFLTFEYGRTKASSGSFEAESISIGMSWNLQRANAK